MGILSDILGLTPNVQPSTLKQPNTTSSEFSYFSEWKCNCGAKLKVRSKNDRNGGSSNFTGTFPAGHPKAGHSVTPTEALTWNGLAEERGWKTHPTPVCPACQRAISVTDYRAKMNVARTGREIIDKQVADARAAKRVVG
jgi:hypothetical protein